MLFCRYYGNSNNEPILFLHGGGLSGEMWEDVVTYLQDDYYCIVPDLPGHGESARVQPLHIDTCMKELEVLIRPFSSIHIVGLSIGGAIAMRLIMTNPKKICTAMISGTSPKLSPIVVRFLQWCATPMYRFLPAKKLTDSMMKSCHIPERYRESVEKATICITPKTARETYGLLRDIQFPKSNMCPLLVVAGEKEAAIVHRNAKYIVETVPNSTYRLIPAVHHAWSYEAPQQFAYTIHEWIDQHKE